MAFLLLGLALLAMKFAEFGPVAAWPWWVVLLPFGLAVAWWAYADATGLTQRRAIEKMEKRKADRRQRDMEALGLGIQRDKRAQRAASSSARAARSEPARPRQAAEPAGAARDAEPAPPPRQDPRL